MFHNIREALNFIETQHSSKASLAKLLEVFSKYNNIEKKLKTIHITGTNGKGSTSKMINDILIKANYKVGLFTSPHMIVANDRIRINNANISDEDLIKYLNLFHDDIVEYKLNFFEVYVIIALHYFYDNNVDICVIEVGIGGRLDATNVINSMISIITNINYDHTNKLGNTLEEIAFEKSGIIKNNNTTITMVVQKPLLEVIKTQVDLNNGQLIALTPIDSTLINEKINFIIENKNYSLNSMAQYQVENAQIAISAIKVLNNKYGYHINEQAIIDGLNEFTWIGRFEKVSSNPNVILDGAHNIAGIKALIASSDPNRKHVVIFSALKDKDYKDMLQLLVNHFEEVVFCEFDFYRGLHKEDIDNLGVKKFSNFEQSLKYAITNYPEYDILVCGSLYFISEIRKFLVV